MLEAINAGLPQFANGGLVSVGGSSVDMPITSAGTVNNRSNAMTINQQFTVNAPAGTVSRATEMQIAAAAARGAQRANMRNN
jgi:hypothetical protein